MPETQRFSTVIFCTSSRKFAAERSPLLLLAMLGVLLVVGCATAPSAPARAPRAPQTVEVPRTVITPSSSANLPELFAEARALAAAGRHGEAARKFERVATLEPTGQLAHEAMFQMAVEDHAAGALERAMNEYEQVARRFPDRDYSLLAVVRAISVALHLERWEHAGQLTDLALQSPTPMGPKFRVAVYAGGALSRLYAGDEKGASWFIEKGRALIDEHQLDAAGRIDYELAPLYFALGELRRIRGERIAFVPTPKNFGEVMESRCQLLLDAQSAYSDVFRARDSHWSAMAGFRVGELYERLHQDLMQIPAPAAADNDDKRLLFQAAMRLRYVILLEKALGWIRHTLTMAANTGEASSWVERSRAIEAKILETQRKEQELLAASPYSKATIEAALKDLEARSQAGANAAPGTAPKVSAPAPAPSRSTPSRDSTR